MPGHATASREDWLAARRKLLAREKELTKLQEAVAAERRALPWVKLDKHYAFDTAEGPRSLAQLFEGKSQLIVYHFMFSPDWDAGCPGCSFLCDHVDGANLHLKHRDVRFVAIARAPLVKLSAYRERMGWHIPFVSSHGGDFNYDFGVSFTKEQLDTGRVPYNFEMIDNKSMEDLHGTSVFIKKEDGAIYHTYSAYARGDERSLGTYAFLDLTPKGRDENNNMVDWLKRHDEYDVARAAAE